MKQFPTSNFPVRATSLASWNERVPWDLFDGAFNVQLNVMTSVVFVPSMPAEFLDPAAELPVDWEHPTTPQQAYIYGVVGSRYVVTTCDTDVGVRTFEDRAVFFVRAAEYRQLARELEALSDEPSRYGRPVSRLAGQQIARLLTDVIIPSPAFSEDARYWLTDP